MIVARDHPLAQLFREKGRSTTEQSGGYCRSIGSDVLCDPRREKVNTGDAISVACPYARSEAEDRGFRYSRRSDLSII